MGSIIEQHVDAGVNPVVLAAELAKFKTDDDFLKHAAKKEGTSPDTAIAYIQSYLESKDGPLLFVPFFCRPEIERVLGSADPSPTVAACQNDGKKLTMREKRHKERKRFGVSRRN